MRTTAYRANVHKLIILAVLVLLAAVAYLTVEVNPKYFSYAMSLRVPKLIVMLIAAFAIHVATRLMFPEAPNHTLSIIVLCMLAIGNAVSDRGARRRAGNDRQ